MNPMNMRSANVPQPIDDAFERPIKDIGIPPRPIIIDRVVAEMRKEDPKVAAGSVEKGLR